NAYDGVLVRDADHLSAFTEVWSSCNSGIKTEELCSAANHLKGKYKGVVHGNTDMEKVYDSFSTKCFL
ncbi:MAG: hydrolase, partial [Chlorobi bacterium]|nr:hydrolase [Chlorobiota bacterium]